MLINFIKNCHSYPNVEVRNRALLVSNIPLDAPTVKFNTNNMTTEKYYVSNEDFLLYETNGKTDVVTEQMTAYPYIDLSNGDFKQTPYDQHAIFRQGLRRIQLSGLYGFWRRNLPGPQRCQTA